MAINPIIQGILAAYEASGTPSMESLDPATARKLSAAARPQVPPISLERIEQLSIPVEGAKIGARLYASSKKANLPLLVFYHGGGWVLGDLDSHDGVCRSLAKETGAIVVSVDYRLAPEHKFPTPLYDCYQAKEWLVKNGGDLGIDSSRLAVGGDSAGGNLAAAVAMMTQQIRSAPICHQMLFYPVTDYGIDTASYRAFAEGFYLGRREMMWFWDHYLTSKADGANPLASPLRAPSLTGLPPATIFTADHDPLRDEGKAYAEALKAAGVAVNYRDFAGMIHGFVNLLGIVPAASQAIAAAGTDLSAAFSGIQGSGS